MHIEQLKYMEIDWKLFRIVQTCVVFEMYWMSCSFKKFRAQKRFFILIIIFKMTDKNSDVWTK